MNRLAFQVTCIIALAVALIWSVWPLNKTLRLGRDLRGGVSLVYAVKMPVDAQPELVLKQVIEVLKQRVNPTGVLDISFVPQGRDRIEVIMPLPGADVRQKQLTFRQALADLVKRSGIDGTDLEQSLVTGTTAQRFGSSDPLFQQRLTQLQAAFDEVKSSKIALQEAIQSGGDVSAAENALAKSDLSLESKMVGIAGKGISESRLLRVLALDNSPRPIRNGSGDIEMESNGTPRMGASDRERGLQAIRNEFAGSAKDIDATLVAFTEYDSIRTSLDDPEDLKRLFRGAGVLDFRIAMSNRMPEGVNPEQMRKELAERGPIGSTSALAAWFPINDPKQWGDTPAQIDALLSDPASFFAGRDLIGASYDGKPYVLLATSAEKILTHTGSGHSWSLESASRSIDELGRTSIAFRLDTTGGQEMGRLTGPNIGRAMAIVLDGQVYTAPTLQSRIGGNGQITGSFDEDEIKYLIRVLSSGALEGQLSSEPVSMNVLGPSIGADNLERGLAAVMLSIGVTAVAMLLYYFVAGFIANLSLIVNAAIIFGVMAFMDATFTLPGLAGISLSVAMAVDANVLIYERIREEMIDNQESLRNAIRLGFARAFSAIFDGNITNLSVCLVLILFAGTEVKGFGVTMAIGVFATFISGLWITRVLLAVWSGWMGQRTLPMLPVQFPAVARALKPNIDWITLRPMLLGGSLVVALLGVIMVMIRGGDIFETEFRGGVSMTMTTRQAKSGEDADATGRLLLSRVDVENKIRAFGVSKASDPILSQLESANVLSVGEQTKDFRASSFQIKVGNPTSIDDESKITSSVTNAVVGVLASDLDARLPSTFTGVGDTSHASHTYPLEKDKLGDNIARSGSQSSVGSFRGGVAVVIDNINPPITTADLQERITRLRNQPDFSEIAGRDTLVVGLTPADSAQPDQGQTSVAVLVSDPQINSLKGSIDAWDSNLAAKEWKLVSSAVAQGTTLDQVSSFSPAVARTLVANATVAVLMSLFLMLGYIWVRFGSLRFSFATVLAVLFNLAVCLGFLSISRALGDTTFGASILMSDFRIDLNVVAGLLTIVGYSLNDTVVILDRIRENRGKATYVTRAVVNLSINQTFSRTLLTGGSTIATAIILYSLGGTGIRPFAVTFLVGLIAGTFSSIAIAGTIIYRKNEDPTAQEMSESDSRANAKVLPA